LARKSDGDKPKTFFQMDRFVQMNGEWFYTTREGEERGPFDSRSEAEGDLIDYIRQLNHLATYGVKK
jgi:hypothetical protein